MPEKLMVKTYDADTKTIEGERAFNVTITTTVTDRDGDIVEAKGAKLANFRKNPVVLMAHDYRGLPIARAENLEKTDDYIKSKVIFPPEGDYPLADTVYRLYKGKFMRAWSIGFIPIKTEDIVDEDEKNNTEILRRKGRRIKSWELLEFSGCSVPSNPEALNNMLEKGINIDTLKKAGFIEIENDTITKPEETEEFIHIPVRPASDFVGSSFRTIDIDAKKGIKAVIGKLKTDPQGSIHVQKYIFDKNKGWTMASAQAWVNEHKKEYEDIKEKGVIPYKETPKAPEDETWDAGREVREAEVSDLKIMCAWFDSENPDIKTAYKLPHHKAKGHAVVWKAVAAAMGALLGARGGVNIPASDKNGVYNHLVKHYKQFDKEPPELRDYEETELKEFFSEEKQDKIFDIEKIYEIVKENKELKEKVDKLELEKEDLELKVGAVLNKKNKQDLKDAQAKIQNVLDSAEPVEEDSLEIEEAKNNKDDNTIIDIEDSAKDDKGIDEAKLEEIIEKTFKESNKNIKEHFNKKLDYIMGRVK